MIKVQLFFPTDFRKPLRTIDAERLLGKILSGKIVFAEMRQAGVRLLCQIPQDSPVLKLLQPGEDKMILVSVEPSRWMDNEEATHNGKADNHRVRQLPKRDRPKAVSTAHHHHPAHDNARRSVRGVRQDHAGSR